MSCRHFTTRCQSERTHVPDVLFLVLVVSIALVALQMVLVEKTSFARFLGFAFRCYPETAFSGVDQAKEGEGSTAA